MINYMAQLISRYTGGDLFRLEPVDAYPTNHEELLQRAADEMRSDVRPEINSTIENSEEYDVIFVGYKKFIISKNLFLKEDEVVIYTLFSFLYYRKNSFMLLDKYKIK